MTYNKNYVVDTVELDHENTTTVAMDDAARELAFREQVLEVLESRKNSSDDRQRGRLDRLMDSVRQGDAGWQDQNIIKGVIRDIKKAEQKAIKQQQTADAEMGIVDLIETYNFHIKASGTAQWYYQNPVPNIYGVREWIGIKQDALKAAFPQLDTVIRMGEGVEDFNSLKQFNKKLVEGGRKFTKIIQSYHDQPNALNIMQRGVSQPAEDGSADYHWLFDAIFESLSGGRVGSDEFESFRRTIWAKYLHPENTYIPNIVICDVVGRGGKGLFSNCFLRRLFMGNIADNCNIDHVIGKFNSVVAGKAMIVVNETNRSRVDSERTKAFLGSPSILVEPKGLDVYHADNTALVMFVTNDVNGGVNVGGTKSDNRFSFYNVKESIYTACSRYITDENKPFAGEVTETTIKQWIEGHAFDSGQNILHNEDEMGKWISAMIKLYGDVTHIEPHHSQEYRRIVDIQRGAWTRTVESIFDDPAFTYIRAQLLVEMIRHYNKGEVLPGKNRIRQEVERLIADRGWAIEYKERAHLYSPINSNQSSQRTVWCRSAVTVLTEGEAQYGFKNEKGVWEWTWEM